MTVTHLPLVGDGTSGGAGGPLVSLVGGSGAGTAVARASITGMAGAGRKGSLRYSGLLLFSALATDNDNPIIATLAIPPGILAVPTTLAAIDADNEFDYTLLLPQVTAQLVAAGATVSFPTTLADGSFLFARAAAADAAIALTAGVTGLNPPSEGYQQGQVNVSLYVSSLTGLTGAAVPTAAMVQLTVDWLASSAN